MFSSAIGAKVSSAISQAVSNAVTGMVTGAINAGINYIAGKAAQGISKSIGGNFGAALGQIAGGAISAGLGGAASGVLNSTFNTDRFRIGGQFGFNTEQIVGTLIGAAGQDIGRYVQNKVGGYGGFALSNIIYAATGAAQAALFNVPYQQLDYQFISEFGNANFDVQTYLASSIPGNYLYPADLGDRYWIRFNFKEYDRASVGSTANFISGDSIRLPTPANLLDNYSLQYNTTNLGALGGVGAEKVAEILNSTSASPQEIYNTARGVNEVLFSQEMVGVMLRRAAGALSDSVQTSIDQITGNILNPYATQAFQGVDLKSHQFTWRFSPRDPQESNQLRFIINKLKFHSAPVTSNSGLRMKYPSVVVIEIYNGGYLFPFKPCFISGITVNYAPSGVPAFFKGTNAPTEIELSMSLREIEIQDRQFIAQNAMMAAPMFDDRGFDPGRVN